MIVRCKHCWKAIVRTEEGEWVHTNEHPVEPEERWEQMTAAPGERR